MENVGGGDGGETVSLLFPIFLKTGDWNAFHMHVVQLVGTRQVQVSVVTIHGNVCKDTNVLCDVACDPYYLLLFIHN